MSGTEAARAATSVRAVAEAARGAARALAAAPREAKDRALRAAADRLEAAREAILAANAEDLRAATAAGEAPAFLDRLRLDADRLWRVATAVRAVADLPDPVGVTIREWTRPNGLRISKVRVPIGVVAVIFESRPNVAADAAALCLKSGNVAVLRGGSEAFRTNAAIVAAISEGISTAGLPAAAVSTLPSADRASVLELLRMSDLVDLVVPRGGKGLIDLVVSNARIPVVYHGDGICAVYVDAAADAERAERIVLNAKCQRPGVCNAAETLLVHAARAGDLLPRLLDALAARGVEIRGCPRTRAVRPAVAAATEADWRTEFLDLVLAVRVVDSIDEAIAHIEAHGSHHTDSIVTEDSEAAGRFLSGVDSATVLHNASTRFSDGGEFGFGAEVGISTQRLHARGPMGLEDLTTYKYVVRGSGQVRE